MSGMIAYTPGETPLHRTDPLSKLLLVTFATLLAFALPTWLAAIQLAVVLCAALLSHVRGTPLIKPLLLLGGLASLLMVFQVLNYRTGDVVARIGPVAIHADGVDRGLTYVTRVATLMLCSFVFVRTTDPRRLVVGLVHIGIPYRFAWMIFVSLTSMVMFRSQLEMAKEAQLVRGLPPSESVLRQRFDLWRRYAQSMLVLGLRRVEVVSVAMDLRGFAASPRRTFIDPFCWSRPAVVFVALWAAIFVFAVAWRFTA